MTLRMVFEHDDVQRIKLATAPDPMWETVLSLHRARDRGPAARHAEWWKRVRHHVGRDDSAGRWLSTMFDLVPGRGGFPDFLTPGDRMTAMDMGCEAMACTPRRGLQADLGAVFARRRAPGWVRDLARGDRGELNHVVTATRKAHDLLVAPWWPEVQAAVAADRARRAHTLTTEGVGGLLTSLPGVLGWDGDALHLRYPDTRTVRLAGRGLILVPTLFCRGAPVTLIDPDRTPVLVYPATGRGTDVRDDSAMRRLVPVLGRTRAECLLALAAPASTTQLAGRLGTSLGTASKHAAALREAGLVRSVREGGTVWHSLTALGGDLLAGAEAV